MQPLPVLKLNLFLSKKIVFIGTLVQYYKICLQILEKKTLHF